MMQTVRIIQKYVICYKTILCAIAKKNAFVYNIAEIQKHERGKYEKS